MKKMNNKGFSLVELIVVVLIMAIIAVALAPQVMKWVENSRKSTDVQNYGHVAEALEISYSNEKVFKAGGCKISTTTTGTWNATPAASADGKTADHSQKQLIIDSMANTLGSDWAGDNGSMRMRSKRYSSQSIYVGMTDKGILVRDPYVNEDIES